MKEERRREERRREERERRMPGLEEGRMRAAGGKEGESQRSRRDRIGIARNEEGKKGERKGRKIRKWKRGKRKGVHEQMNSTPKPRRFCDNAAVMDT